LPDKRAHRGPNPEDAESFAPAAQDRLRAAVGDYCWLLSRGYAETSALKIVGDHFLLTQRQRTAVMRCSCSDESLSRRRQHQISAQALAGQPLLIDGYNILTTVEAALAGGVILHARDGCYRDMASMHGTFRNVEETIPALTLTGEFLAELHISRCTWYLDSPVSNSGRLKQSIQALAAERGWTWQVDLIPSPDAILSKANEIIATADSVILDRCQRWFNLGREIVHAKVPDERVMDLSTGMRDETKAPSQ
jgi:hypothetical protein